MHPQQQQTRFERLIAEHRGIVLKVAYAYASGPHDREDLTQEILAQVWRSIGTLDPSRSASTWMYRVALNVAISQARRAAVRGGAGLGGGGVEERSATEVAGRAEVEPDERLGPLMACVESLDPLNRALLVMYLDGRSARETGDVLGLSETNVTTRVSRLKERLRRGVEGITQGGNGKGADDGPG